MIPGEILPAQGTLTLNAGAAVTTLVVANTGDRPVQIGSHYHFAEANPALDFDRTLAHGHRLDIAAGTAVRFEPGQRREVHLIPLGGARRVFGFNGRVMGPLVLALALLMPLCAAPVRAQTPVQTQTQAACSTAGTQQQINACAAAALGRADAALNTAWGPAKTFAKAIGQSEALLEAQRAWIKYRDAACTVHASPYAGGSIQPMIRDLCLTEVTVQRTRMLRDFHAY